LRERISPPASDLPRPRWRAWPTTFNPFPAPPFDGDVWAALGTVVLGVALAVVPAVHGQIARSELLRAARSGTLTAEASSSS